MCMYRVGGEDKALCKPIPPTPFLPGSSGTSASTYIPYPSTPLASMACHVPLFKDLQTEQAVLLMAVPLCPHFTHHSQAILSVSTSTIFLLILLCSIFDPLSPFMHTGWLPAIPRGCWSLIFPGSLNLFSLGWRPHHSLLGGRSLSPWVLQCLPFSPSFMPVSYID